MEPMFSYRFQPATTAWIIFGGLAFAGIGLRFMFWLDFRKRFAKGGHVAGTIVLDARES